MTAFTSLICHEKLKRIHIEECLAQKSAQYVTSLVITIHVQLAFLCCGLILVYVVPIR